jgi:signal transduction histidine kinase
MNDSPSELAPIVQRCLTGIAAIFRQAVALSDRAEALADLLRELVPSAARWVCLLNGEGAPCLALRPHEAGEDERKIFLKSLLSSFDPLASGARKFAVEAWPDTRVLAAAIHEDERPRGFLALGFTGASVAADAGRAEAVLMVAAAAVASRWTVESLRREQAELASFALVGQAFAGLAHDLNNALNSMMLQTSVVQLRVDPKASNDLAAIRQHGAQAAGLVRSLQQVVQERREKSYPVDLNNVLTEVLHEEPELRRRVSPQLSEQSPQIACTRSAVKQLVRLLLEGVCAGTNATVSARIEKQQGGAALRILLGEVTADTATQNDPPILDVLLWQNLDEIGRQAGQSLLRQLGGVLTAEHGSDDTLSLCVTWGQSN